MTTNPLIRFLHRDSHLLVCIKPPQLLTVPHHNSTSPTLIDLVRSQLVTAGERHYIQSVHRLDYGVGGLVVFGRSDKGVSRMNKLFATPGKVEKSYIGVLASSGKGTTEVGETSGRITIDIEGRGGKIREGVTDYKVEGGEGTRVRFFPLTGRR